MIRNITSDTRASRSLVTCHGETQNVFNGEVFLSLSLRGQQPFVKKLRKCTNNTLYRGVVDSPGKGEKEMKIRFPRY